MKFSFLCSVCLACQCYCCNFQCILLYRIMCVHLSTKLNSTFPVFLLSSHFWIQFSTHTSLGGYNVEPTSFIVVAVDAAAAVCRMKLLRALAMRANGCFEWDSKYQMDSPFSSSSCNYNSPALLYNGITKHTYIAR